MGPADCTWKAGIRVIIVWWWTKNKELIRDHTLHLAFITPLGHSPKAAFDMIIIQKAPFDAPHPIRHGRKNAQATKSVTSPWEKIKFGRIKDETIGIFWTGKRIYLGKTEWHIWIKVNKDEESRVFLPKPRRNDFVYPFWSDRPTLKNRHAPIITVSSQPHRIPTASTTNAISWSDSMFSVEKR